MKKIILFLGLVSVLNLPANAVGCTNYSCVKPYDLSAGASRFLSSVTGSNLLSQKVAQAIIKKEIQKNTQNVSDLKVQVKSYSGKDLKAGRFKSMKMSGKNITLGDVHISELEAKTICNFNYISPKGSSGQVEFKEDFPVAFRATMSQDDINKMTSASGYKKVIDDLNSVAGSFGIFKISSTSVKIQDNKFLYVLKLAVPFIKKEQDVVIASDLKVKNGEVCFEDTHLMSSNFKMDLSKISYILNYLNPLDYSLDIIDNSDTKLNIQSVSIIDNKVVLEGIVTVLKNTVK